MGVQYCTARSTLTSAGQPLNMGSKNGTAHSIDAMSSQPSRSQSQQKDCLQDNYDPHGQVRNANIASRSKTLPKGIGSRPFAKSLTCIKMTLRKNLLRKSHGGGSRLKKITTGWFPNREGTSLKGPSGEICTNLGFARNRGTNLSGFHRKNMPTQNSQEYLDETRE